MKNFQQTVKDYLEKEPRGRERKTKDRGLLNLLIKRYAPLKVAVNNGILSKELLVSVLQDYASMDRAWRKVLEENEELRGKDYDEKVPLEQEAKIKLGYEARAPIPAHIQEHIRHD